MGMQWAAWGTTVGVDVTNPDRASAARRLVIRCIEDAERAADLGNRRAEVYRLVRSAGRPVRVRPLLAGLVAVAIGAAERSGGAVDPTVGAATLPLLRPRWASGDPLPVCGALPGYRARSAPGWRSVEWTEQSISLPAGACLDLTATAKAWTAQRAANLVAERCGTGALVEIGGDVATAGPAPIGGWTVVPEHAGATVVQLDAGTAVASCRAVGIIDPLTGRPVRSPWTSVAVAGPDVVAAKVAAVTALVHGDQASAYLDQLGVHAVLVPAERGARPHASSSTRA
jgi:thiamine biosynthesis lipoprotein